MTASNKVLHTKQRHCALYKGYVQNCESVMQMLSYQKSSVVALTQNDTTALHTKM